MGSCNLRHVCGHTVAWYKLVARMDKCRIKGAGITEFNSEVTTAVPDSHIEGDPCHSSSIENLYRESASLSETVFFFFGYTPQALVVPSSAARRSLVAVLGLSLAGLDFS
jgi:hypothetical protein